MKRCFPKSLISGASTSLLIAATVAISSTVAAQTRVNVGHLAPFDADIANTAVSVEVGGSEVLTGVVFNQFSGYLELTGAGVAPGMTLVEVFAPPATPPAAITDTFDLPADTDFTVAAIGGPNSQPLDYLVLTDDQTPPTAGNAKIRVVHAAPFSDTPVGSAVSVRTQDGTLVNGLNNVQYTQDSGFFELPAGNYDLKISTPDDSATLIDPLPVDLPDGAIVTLFATGDGVNQPLGITAVFGDGTFAALEIETGTRVNVAHLAPFAPVTADTAVSVDVAGGEVLNGVVFNQTSGYLDLGAGPGVAPGMTQVEIFAPPGTPPAAIDDTFDLLADTDYTVAAIGDGTNQPLALLPLIDDLSDPSAGNAKIRVVHTAPFAAALPDTAVSIRLDEGGVVNGLNSVQYGQNSGFFELPAGTYDLVIATPDGSTDLINPAPVTLADGDIVSLFAVGDGANQALGITAVFEDGSSVVIGLEAGFAPIPTLGTMGLMIMIALLAVVAIRRLI